MTADGVAWVRAFRGFAELASVAGMKMVGVDMSIGLPRSSPRRRDAQARGLVGSRRSSVFSFFPPPPRGARSRELCRRSARVGTYSRPRYLEAELLAEGPDLRGRWCCARR
ncbi:MAG: DUF429 domain-containing protein [Planctomycetota bacterium]